MPLTEKDRKQWNGIKETNTATGSDKEWQKQCKSDWSQSNPFHEESLRTFRSVSVDANVDLCQLISLYLVSSYLLPSWENMRQHMRKLSLSISDLSLRKHAYTNILKLLPPKTENFQLNNFDIFHISALNIDCGYSLEPPRRGGSNKNHNLCFRAEIRKIM